MSQSQVSLSEAFVDQIAAEGEAKAHIPDKALEHALLRASVLQNPEFHYIKDIDSRFVIMSKITSDFHGFPDPNDMIGRTDLDISPPGRAMTLFRDEQEMMRLGKPRLDVEEHVIDAEGTARWFATSKLPLRDDEGNVIGMIGHTRDVTARKRADLLREEQTVILGMIAMNASLPKVLDRLVLFIETQIPGRLGAVMLMADDGASLIHATAPSLPPEYGRAVRDLPVGPSSGCCGTAAHRREPVISGDIASDPLWATYRDAAAGFELASCASVPILNHEGEVLGTIAIYSHEPGEPSPADLNVVTRATRMAAIAIERQKAEARIRHLANHDSLTGLPNRALFMDRLERAILATQRGNPSLAVAFIDIDGFKGVNDTLGHAAGDELLKALATRMSGSIRAVDTIGRMGGDEFVIVLVDLPENPDVVIGITEKIRRAIAEPLWIGGKAMDVTCSIGVAVYPDGGMDANTLVRNADRGMYEAKREGRNRVHFWDDDPLL